MALPGSELCPAMMRHLTPTEQGSALILTPDIKEHLGITDAVDVVFEEGRVVLRKPEGAAAPGMDFEEAKALSHQRYAESYRELAK